MLQLKDIMTRDVVTLSPDLGIRDAMNLLVERRVGGAPVVASGKVVGILTLSDLVDFAARLPGVPQERPSARDDDEWEEDAEEAEDDQSPASFFADMWEDSGADVAERFAESGGPEWNTLEGHVVSEVMSSGKLMTLPSTTPVAAAADFLRTARVHRVLVMDRGKLLGIVSTMDFTKAVADGKLTKNTYVFGAPKSFDERGWGGRAR